MSREKQTMIFVLMSQLEREIYFAEIALKNKKKLIKKLKNELGVITDVK